MSSSRANRTKKMVRATDAKEVGVGDPAEGNDLLLRPKSHNAVSLSFKANGGISEKIPYWCQSNTYT